MKKSTLNSMVSVIDAAFKEEDHPRGDDGKFLWTCSKNI